MENINKRKRRKLLSCLMAAFLMLQVLLPTVANAANFNLTEQYISGSTYFGSSKWGNGSVLSLDGEPAFCLEPNKLADIGTNSSILPSDIGLSHEDMQILSLISYYGWRGVGGGVTNYFLTQNLIWKYLGSSQRVAYGGYDTEAEMTPWFNSVMAKVNRFSVLPSFHNNTYTVDFGESLTIEDTKGVLNELTVVSVTGGTAKISGNKLTITPNGSVDNMAIRFTRPISGEQTSTNFVVRSGNSQAVSRLVGKDPYTANVKMKVNLKGKIDLEKISESGKKIEGAVFNIKNADGSFDKDLTTDSNGKFLTDWLDPGKYTVTEKSVPAPYLLDTTPKEVTVEAGKTATVSFSNNVARGDFKLVKKGLDGELLSGAEYRVYSVGNDAEGNPINYNETFTTDENGEINIKELKLGKYEYVETKAPDGYVLDPKAYSFELTYKDMETAIVEAHGEAVDKQVIFIKENVFGKLLSGGEFEIREKIIEEDINTPTDDENSGEGDIDAQDEPLFSFTAKEEGVIIPNLEEGKTYILTEKEAPSGYVIGEPIEFTVTEDKELQTVKMTNEYIVGEIDVKDIAGLSDLVVTGDGFKVAVIAVIMVLAMFGTGILAYRGKNKKG